MSPSTPRLAILGSGLFPKQAYCPALAALPAGSFELKAIYSRSLASARSLADTAQDKLSISDIELYAEDQNGKGLEALLANDQIDAVAIALPITSQPEFIFKALKAGKHVLSEKPVGKDVDTAKALIKTYVETYKPKGLIWRVAENFECEPVFRKAGEILQSGQIGALRNFSWETINRVEQEGNQWLNTAWRTVPSYQGGFILDGGVHTPAALRQILPSPISTVVGHTSLVLPYLPPTDTLVAALTLADGTLGTLRKTWAAPPGKPLGDFFEAWCEKGWLTISPSPTAGELRLTVYENGTEVFSESFARRGVEFEFASFLGAVGGRGQQAWEKEGEEIGNPAGGVLQDLAVIQAGLQSHGKLVTL